MIKMIVSQQEKLVCKLFDEHLKRNPVVNVVTDVMGNSDNLLRWNWKPKFFVGHIVYFLAVSNVMKPNKTYQWNE